MRARHPLAMFGLAGLLTGIPGSLKALAEPSPLTIWPSVGGGWVRGRGHPLPHRRDHRAARRKAKARAKHRRLSA